MEAKLVSFVITTRVVVDGNATEEQIVDTALAKIAHDPMGYISADCLEDIKDDKECPYNGTTDNPFKGKERSIVEDVVDEILTNIDIIPRGDGMWTIRSNYSIDTINGKRHFVVARNTKKENLYRAKDEAKTPVEYTKALRDLFGELMVTKREYVADYIAVYTDLFFPDILEEMNNACLKINS